MMAKMGLPLGFVAPKENALYDEEADNVALKVPRKTVAKDKTKKKKAGETLNFKTDKVCSSEMREEKKSSLLVIIKQWKKEQAIHCCTA